MVLREYLIIFREGEGDDTLKLNVNKEIFISNLLQQSLFEIDQFYDLD